MRCFQSSVPLLYLLAGGSKAISIKCMKCVMSGNKIFKRGSFHHMRLVEEKHVNPSGFAKLSFRVITLRKILTSFV